ncbi:MAG: hypothetical protein PWQ71_136 [Bacteroidota bacterium]|jgi:hypothetical protein|nr:hypothetical protein [Bacteroidota bacterium]
MVIRNKNNKKHRFRLDQFEKNSHVVAATRIGTLRPFINIKL